MGPENKKPIILSAADARNVLHDAGDLALARTPVYSEEVRVQVAEHLGSLLGAVDFEEEYAGTEGKEPTVDVDGLLSGIRSRIDQIYTEQEASQASGIPSGSEFESLNAVNIYVGAALNDRLRDISGNN